MTKPKKIISEADTDRLLLAIKTFADDCDRAGKPDEIEHLLDECAALKFRRTAMLDKADKALTNEAKRLGIAPRAPRTPR